MSETASLTRITRDTSLGMIALRGGIEVLGPTLASLDCALPERRATSRAGDLTCAWMAPDEFLLMLPAARASATAAGLARALGQGFALAVDVSDARVVFHLEGPRAREVLMKLCPVDFDALGPDEIRRTRAAQVAVALWQSGAQRFSLMAFRSVEGYVAELLHNAARPGSGLFAP